jgi:hypothetical protein
VQKHRIYLSVVALSLCLCSAIKEAFAECSMPSNDSQEYMQWRKSLDFKKYWRSSSDNPGLLVGKGGSVKIRIDRLGQIQYLAMKLESGDAQFDFSCLESVANAVLLKPLPKTIHLYPPVGDDKTIVNNFEPDRYQTVVSFPIDSVPALSPEADAFYRHHPGLKGRCYLFHLIPLGIKEHNPSAFTDAELTSESNLLALKANVEPDEAIRPFITAWQSFLIKNKQASRIAIKAEAQKIEEKFNQYIFVLKP